MPGHRMLTPAQINREQLRKQVLNMWEKELGYGTIARKLGLAKATVQSIVKRFRGRDVVADLPKKGRRKLVNARCVNFINCIILLSICQVDEAAQNGCYA